MKKRILYLFVSVLFLASCSEYNKILKSTDYDIKYEYAKKRDLDPEEVLPYFEKQIPMHRLASLTDIIQSAVFLLSDSSSYLTGQSIKLTGGEWMD